MRVLLIALLAAISYAQTEEKLEGAFEFKEFSNPENIAGVYRRWNILDDLNIEIPLSVTGRRLLAMDAASAAYNSMANKGNAIYNGIANAGAFTSGVQADGTKPGGHIGQNPAPFHDGHQMSTMGVSPIDASKIKIVDELSGKVGGGWYNRMESILGKAKEPDSWVQRLINKGIGKVLPAKLAGRLTAKMDIIKPMMENLEDAAKTLDGSLEYIKQILHKIKSKVTNTGGFAPTLGAEVQNFFSSGFWNLVLNLRRVLGLHRDSKYITFGVGTSIQAAAVGSFSLSGSFMMSVKDGQTVSVSAAFGGAIGIGAGIDVGSAGIILHFSHNTEAGGEGGCGLSLDFGVVLGAGMKATLNWAFRNKGLDFTGFSLQVVGSITPGAVAQVQFTYTAVPMSLSLELSTPNDVEDNTGAAAMRRAFALAATEIGATDMEGVLDDLDGLPCDLPDLPDESGMAPPVGPPGSPPGHFMSSPHGSPPGHFKPGDPNYIMPIADTEVKTSFNSKDNIKRIFELMHPSMLEFFCGALLLSTLVFFSARKAERKDEYLLISDDHDEI